MEALIRGLVASKHHPAIKLELIKRLLAADAEKVLKLDNNEETQASDQTQNVSLDVKALFACAFEMMFGVPKSKSITDAGTNVYFSFNF